MRVIDEVAGIQLITKNDNDRVGTLVLAKDSISPWDILKTYERFRESAGIPQEECATITYNADIDELDVGGWDLDIRNNVSVACNIVATEKEDMSTEAAQQQLHQVLLTATVVSPIASSVSVQADASAPVVDWNRGDDTAVPAQRSSYFNTPVTDLPIPTPAGAEVDYGRGQLPGFTHIDQLAYLKTPEEPRDYDNIWASKPTNALDKGASANQSTSISAGVSVQTISSDIIAAPVIGNVQPRKNQNPKNKQPSAKTPNNQQRPQKQQRQQDNHNHGDQRNNRRDDYPQRQPEPPRRAAPSTNGVAALLARATNSSHLVPEDTVHYVNTNASCCRNQIAAKLDMGARCPFYYGALGTFSSIYAVWAHLKYEFPADDIRELAGNRARMAIQEAPHRPIEGLQIILADATWMKVCETPQLLEFMLHNTLPYENMYYADAGGVQVVRHPVTNGWYMPVLEEIARTVKVRAETNQPDLVPDFSFLAESPYYDPTFDMSDEELRAFLHERREERKIRRNDDYRNTTPNKRQNRPHNPVISERIFNRR